MRSQWVGLWALACVLATPWAARAADLKVDFTRDIRPILSDRCFFCHGPDDKHRKGSLRLDQEKAAREAGAIVPGKPEESELFKRITAAEAHERMPPAKVGKDLSPAQVALLKKWIAEGGKYADHWAYVAPRKVDVPAVQDEKWPVNHVDRFILARLEREKLKPAEDADRRTLIRRLAFDLTGLPPSPKEVEDFGKDEHPQAVERLVDRLLASEHYGERMAMYWLDLVRYADTVGYHGDQDHHASPYRDYVIDSFNRNIRFDQFTCEQLAGDLLPKTTDDQRIATCYNRLLQTSHEGGVQPKEYLAMYAADRVRNLSAVWMGATVGCAQCHTHKFDPYTIRDFYSLSAFFADIDEEKHLRGGGADAIPTKRPPEVPLFTRQERERLATLEKQLADEPGNAAAKTELAGLNKRKRMVMVTQAVPPRTVRVLPRGNWLDETGEIVQPAVPTFLGKLNVQGRATRLDLANWLVDGRDGVGGLTARVFVNRIWYLAFGSGLANSLEDFGAQGEPPVHPELLDALALEFVQNGWDVKLLWRRIVLSRAYRQSSRETAELKERDPENRLYARQSRFRLAAEMIRDQALSISGLLIHEVGGPSSKPYQPAGYYRHLNFPARVYTPSSDAAQWRRGVYTHWQRQYLHPMLKAFDAPTREECTARRPRSNTPLAALVLLNDPTFVESARVLGQRVLKEGGTTDAERLAFAFREVTGRSPDETERVALLRLLEKSRAAYQADAKAAKSLLAVGKAPLAAGVDAVELAAWTATGRALLNLSEILMRE